MNAEDDAPYHLKIIAAHTWWRRAGGLLIRPRLKSHEALWLRPCWSIHTMGLSDTIAVFFLDRHNRVIDCRPQVRPNRIAWHWHAKSVIETVPLRQDQIATVSYQLELALLSGGGGG